MNRLKFFITIKITCTIKDSRNITVNTEGEQNKTKQLTLKENASHTRPSVTLPRDNHYQWFHQDPSRQFTSIQPKFICFGETILKIFNGVYSHNFSPSYRASR